jgi:hypothetical protein
MAHFLTDSRFVIMYVCRRPGAAGSPANQRLPCLTVWQSSSSSSSFPAQDRFISRLARPAARAAGFTVVGLKPAQFNPDVGGT